MSDIVRCSVWAGLPELIEELGGDVSRVLTHAKVSQDDLQHPQAYLPFDSFLRTLNAAAEETGRSDFGMLGARRGGFDALGVLGVAMRNARTIRESLQIGIRFLRFTNTAVLIRHKPVPRSQVDMLEVRLHRQPGADAAQFFEWALAELHTLANVVSDDRLAAEGFLLPHGQISDDAAYVSVLGQLPEFEQDTVAVLFPRENLKLKILDRSKQLGDAALAQLRSHWDTSDTPFSESAQHMAKLLIETDRCSRRELARAMGVHERTLLRRLGEEGATFETVRDEARRELALSLLRQKAHSFTEISLMLGYTDSATFTRSCKRWFGATPTQIRAQRKRS